MVRYYFRSQNLRECCMHAVELLLHGSLLKHSLFSLASFFFSTEWHFHQYPCLQLFSWLVKVLFVHMWFLLGFQGITFDEFRSFFQFLNNLEDFAIAMQMYNFAARSIGQGRNCVRWYRHTGSLHTYTDALFFLKPNVHKPLTIFVSYQMSLREQCMLPRGWSWRGTWSTLSSRSLM